MTQQLVTESPEKTHQPVERGEPRSDSAFSFQGGLHPVAQLQRTLGNRHVAQLIQARQLTPGGKITGLQRKLIVGAADDQYEQEADRVARQVMNTPDAVVTVSAERAPSLAGIQNQPLQASPLAATITPNVQRQKDKEHEAKEDKDREEEKAETLQTKSFSDAAALPQQRQKASDEDAAEPILAKSAGSLSDSFEAGADVETQLSLSKGCGSPLPDPVRAYMEPRFGADFSHVPVHTDREALQMNQAVGAQAFTHGADIYFGSGHSPSNLELTAHELTHAVQQTGKAPLQTKKQEQSITPLVLRNLSSGVVLHAPKASKTHLAGAANQEEMVQRQAHQEDGAPPERRKGPLNFLSTMCDSNARSWAGHDFSKAPVTERSGMSRPLAVAQDVPVPEGGSSAPLATPPAWPVLPAESAPAAGAVLSVSLPQHIRGWQSPWGTPDRIPPRVDTPVEVGVAGWTTPMLPIILQIERAGGGNGTATIDGGSTAEVSASTTVQLRCQNQTDAGKADGLRLAA
jgi:hypothetical protein